MQPISMESEPLVPITEPVELEIPAEKKGKFQFRSLTIPPNRMSGVKANWQKICDTVVQNMKLQIRFNTQKKKVQMRQCDQTQDRGAIQKTYQFLKAYMAGFTLEDSIAMLRLDDLYIETFLIKDVKTVQGDHLSRCIARISGQKGKTKHAVQNATRTRIVLADSRVSIMGSFSNIKSARDAICSLILGTPPGKVYSQLRHVAKKINQRF